MHWIQLKRSAPLVLPQAVVIEADGHVENIADSSGPNHIIMVEQMTSFAVRIDRHLNRKYLKSIHRRVEKVPTHVLLPA